MRRTYRYRLYPTGKQERALEAQLTDACNLYNAALQQRRDAYRSYGESLSFYDQSAELKALRREGLLNSEANSWSQQAVLKRLDRAFQAFFRRCKAGEKPGYPRFRSRSRYETLDFSFAGNAGGIAITQEGRLRLQGIGHIKIKTHRAIPDEAKLCEARITSRNGRWFVSISLKDVAPKPLPKTNRAVGIDLGISTFVATSDDELIEGPRAQRIAKQSVRRASRKVARRKKGSIRRRKAVILLARQREHEANVRRDHAHKTALDLVRRYDTLCVEDLNFRGLSKGMLARECNDQGWAGFVALLQEKAECAAREVILVDARNTSQACSACGVVVSKGLAVRIHECECGYRADRDINAANNVLTKGLDRAFGRKRREKSLKRSPRSRRVYAME